MSNLYWESKSRSQNIPITNLRCLMEALRNTSIQLQNVPQSIHSLEYQEEEYRAALEAYKSSTLNSLQDVTEMQARIEALMRANDLLHKALKNVENEAPASLKFTHNGTPFTAVRAAGSYKLTWTEQVEFYDVKKLVMSRVAIESAISFILFVGRTKVLRHGTCKRWLS